LGHQRRIEPPFRGRFTSDHGLVSLAHEIADRAAFKVHQGIEAERTHIRLVLMWPTRLGLIASLIEASFSVTGSMLLMEAIFGIVRQ